MRLLKIKKIVLIGGGTGSYTILKGLKAYTKRDEGDLTAIVSMMDSGGDTGRLRDEYGILPPGDLRRCLVALSEETELVKKLFQYRFSKGSLRGRSFGNMFFTALTDILGSDERAIKEISKILKIRGKVLPVTLDKVDLCVKLENGVIVRGEMNIDIPKHNPKLRIEQAFLDPPANAYRDAVDAIEKADLLIIGPGDLYTSVIPNLLVKGIPRAIKNFKAKKIYICNLMTKYGETYNFTATDHIRTIEKYLGKRVFDYVIVNNSNAPKKLLEKYEKEKSYPVEYNIQEIYKLGVKKVIEADVMNKRFLIRHNSEKIAKKIIELID